MSKFLQHLMVCLAMVAMPFAGYADGLQFPDPSIENWSGPTFKDLPQPLYWHASNVEQSAVGMTFRFNFAEREAGHTGNYCMKIQDQVVGAAGVTETSPAYFSLGTAWAYLEGLKTSTATAGTVGGMDFTHRPDSVRVWIKRTGDNTDKEDFHILFYSWRGKTRGEKFRNKSGGCTGTTRYDEESDIRQALDGNDCGTEDKGGGQVAEGWLKDRKQYLNWTQITVPIYYLNSNVPEKCNMLFSASNYPNFRANDGLYEGNALYVDDIELIYSSKIQVLRIGGPNGKEWKGFDPNSTEVQTYSLGETATTIPEIVAYRGAGVLTTRGDGYDRKTKYDKTVEFPGRMLTSSELSIEYGDLENKPTKLTVTAEDGGKTVYLIQFQRAASSNANLAGITYTYTDASDKEYTASVPAFGPSKYNYDVELPYGTTKAPTIAYTLGEDAQTAVLTNATSPKGKATIVVTAADKKTTATYTINFSVGKLKDVTLQDILVNDKSIPGFTPSQTVYKVSLPVGTDKMPTIKAVSAYPTGEQTITYEAPSVIDGGTYKVIVSAPGATSPKTYKLNFKIEASSYSYLADLQVVGDQVQSVYPAKEGTSTVFDFEPKTLTYFATLKMGTKTLPKIVPTLGDEFQDTVITRDGLDGTTRIVVTAGNKTDQTAYKIVFSTEKSEISTLLGIQIGGVDLPGFSSDVTEYSYVLPIGTTALPEIKPIAHDEFQTISVLQGGVNGKTRITVTAGNGSTTNYYINFSVATYTDNTLKSLAVEGYDIGFDPEVNEYSVNLINGETVIPEVTYELQSEEYQTARVIAPPAGSKEGDYKITVRPKNGTSRTYIIHFSANKSTETHLKMIYIDGKEIKDYRPDSLHYSDSLKAGAIGLPTVTWDVMESTQRVTPSLDKKVRKLTVKAENGDTLSYTITFIAQVSQNAFLEMIYLDSVPLEGFVKDVQDYFYTFEGERCPEITVKKDPTQQVTITAPYGEGLATILVQSEQGDITPYTITFTRQAPATARLKDLWVEGGTMNETFEPTKLNYTGSYSGNLPTINYEKEYEEQQVQVLWKDTVAWIHVADTLGNKVSYNIAFSYLKSSNNSLEMIYKGGVELPDFSTSKLKYEYDLAPGSTYPEVSYKTAENAEVVFFGQIAEGKWGITVVAEDGTTATYTIQFNIQKYSDATLKDLKLDGVTISGFNPNTFTYPQTLDFGATLPEVSVEAREGQAVMIYQKDTTHQEVIVFAESGANNTYYINYTRVQSSNALLKDILIDGVSLEGFNPHTADYVDTIAWRSKFVPNVFPIGQLPNQTITTYHSRPNGVTRIHVVAQDGTENDYSVAFPVRKSSNTQLGELYLDSEDAEIKGFNPNKTDYEVVLPYEATECPMMVFEKGEPEQRIDLISRPIGETSQIIVTAENGDTRTYNILFKREVSKTKNLLSMIRIVELDQELSLKDKTKRDFDVEMPFGSRSLTVEYEKAYDEQTVFIQPGGVNNPTIITVKANNDTIADEIYTINPIVPTADPAVLTDIRIKVGDGAETTIPGFTPEQFSYIVKVTDRPILRYTLSKGAGINILDQTTKHWKAEVTYGERTNTYEIWYYYTNDVVPNTEFNDWSAKTKYNDKNKPTGWNVVADADEKYSTILGTDRTGEECSQASDGSVYLKTSYRARCCRSVPAFMALGTISGKIDTQNAFTYSGGIVFRNSPDIMQVRYMSPTLTTSNHIIYDLQGSAGSYTIDSIDTKSFSDYKIKSIYLRGANEAVGEPTLLNIVLNSYYATNGALGTEGMGTTAQMYIDWLRFSFNHTLTSMTADAINASRSGNAFTVTLTDPERIEKPILSFTGEVDDQARLVNWAAPTKDADFETRTATIRNYAENGDDYTDYSLTVKRPLDTKNQLKDLLLDSLTIDGFDPATTEYTVHIPATRRNLPSLQPVPGSSLQTVTAVYNDADSTMTITVAPEKGGATVYKVKFVTDLSDDTNLADIVADGLTFDEDTHEYELIAEQMPIIKFSKKSDLQEVSLINGVITVKAENGAVGTYTITRVNPTVDTDAKIKFELGDTEMTDFGGDTYDKADAKPTQKLLFARDFDTDSVVFVQSEAQMQWFVYGTNTADKTYTWTYPTTPSVNADLAAILVDGDTISGFNVGEKALSQITDTTVILNAIPAEDVQTLNVTFAETAGGVVYTTTVTPESGAPQDYTVTVKRPTSSLATLAGILLDGAMLDGFRPDSFDYEITLPTPAVKKAQPKMPSVTYLVGHEGQTVIVKPGQVATVANPVVEYSTIEVTAEDGTGPETYTLTFNAEPSHCSDLTGITVNGILLDYFESGRHFYSTSLQSSDFTLDCTSDDRFQTVDTIIKEVVKDHEYEYTLRVTAEDGTFSDYHVEIYLENQLNDVTLANITLDGKDIVDYRRDINPDAKAFDPGLNTYDVNLPSGMTTRPEVSAQLKMDGQKVEIFQYTDSVLLKVTAQNGVDTNIYRINYYIPLSKNANLSNITYNYGKQVPDFNPNKYFYAIDLDPLTERYFPEVEAEAGEDAQEITMTVDSAAMQFTINVKAEDRAFENTYTLKFTSHQSDADTLLVIYADGDTLEGFRPTEFYYNLSLPVGTDAFPVLSWELADEYQDTTCNVVVDTESSLVRQIIVTSESGKKNTYTVAYTIMKSDVDTLAMLIVDGKALEGFEPLKMEYEYLLTSEQAQELAGALPTVEYIPGDEYQTVLVSQVPDTLSGKKSLGYMSLVTVTAATGKTRTYTIHYPVELSSDATLNMIMVGGQPVENYDSERNNYRLTLLIGQDIPLVTVYKNTEVQSYVISFSGDVVYIDVTAEDGTEKRYSITFERVRSDVSILNNIIITDKAGKQLPYELFDFDPHIQSYDIVLPYDAENVNLDLPNIKVVLADSLQTMDSTYNHISRIETEVIIRIVAPNGEDESEYHLTFHFTLNNDAHVIDVLINGELWENFQDIEGQQQYAHPFPSDSTAFFTAEAIEPILSDPQATATVTVDENGVIAIKVVAQDEQTERTYSIRQTLGKDPDNTLKDLTLDGVTIRGFDPEVTFYTYLLMEGEAVPTVAVVLNSSNADFDINKKPAGDTTLVTVTAQDGTDRVYAIYFQISGINDAAESLASTVFIHRVPGANQLFVSSIRKGVVFRLYDQAGRLVLHTPVQTANPNDVEYGVDNEGHDVLLNVTDYNSGTIVNILPSQIYFYSFIEAGVRKIKSGKIMALPCN